MVFTDLIALQMEIAFTGIETSTHTEGGMLHTSN